VYTNKEQYPYSSLATPTLALPASINLTSKFEPDSLINLQSTSLAVKLQPLALTDNLLIDACEFLNSIYEDMSQINELISLKKSPALVPEGVCMFFNGYLVVNSLQTKFLGKVVQKLKANNLLEQTAFAENPLKAPVI
jgi:hypothetical protein